MVESSEQAMPTDYNQSYVTAPAEMDTGEIKDALRRITQRKRRLAYERRRLEAELLRRSGGGDAE